MALHAIYESFSPESVLWCSVGKGIKKEFIKQSAYLWISKKSCGTYLC